MAKILRHINPLSGLCPVRDRYLSGITFSSHFDEKYSIYNSKKLMRAICNYCKFAGLRIFDITSTNSPTIPLREEITF